MDCGHSSSCACGFCLTWNRVRQLVTSPDRHPEFVPLATARARDLYAGLLDVSEGWAKPPELHCTRFLADKGPSPGTGAAPPPGKGPGAPAPKSAGVIPVTQEEYPKFISARTQRLQAERDEKKRQEAEERQRQKENRPGSAKDKKQKSRSPRRHPPERREREPSKSLQRKHKRGSRKSKSRSRKTSRKESRGGDSVKIEPISSEEESREARGVREARKSPSPVREGERPRSRSLVPQPPAGPPPGKGWEGPIPAGGKRREHPERREQPNKGKGKKERNRTFYEIRQKWRKQRDHYPQGRGKGHRKWLEWPQSCADQQQQLGDLQDQLRDWRPETGVVGRKFRTYRLGPSQQIPS